MVDPEKLEGGTSPYELARELVGDWEFESHSDEANARFVLYACVWLIDLHEGYLQYRSDEFAGEEAPASIQPLLAHEWQGKRHLSGENIARLLRRDDFETVACDIPEWDEVSNGKSFEETIAAIRQRPDILAGIREDQVYFMPGIVATFEPHFHHDWGLNFYVTSRGIEVHVFGKDGHKAPASRYAQGYSNHPRVLASAALELALLTSRHFRHEITLGEDEIALQKLRWEALQSGDLKLLADASKYDFPPRSSLKRLAVERLKGEGLLPQKS